MTEHEKQSVEECPHCRNDTLNVSQYEWRRNTDQTILGTDIQYKCLHCGWGRIVPEKLL